MTRIPVSEWLAAILLTVAAFGGIVVQGQNAGKPGAESVLEVTDATLVVEPAAGSMPDPAPDTAPDPAAVPADRPVLAPTDRAR